VSRKVFHFFGELLVTASALIFLYLIYNAWFSNVTAQVQTAELAQEIEQIYELHDAKPLSSSKSTPVALASQQIAPIGLLYIPRLQDKVWGLPVVEGVGTKELALGVGHYSSTELPGEIGNFAIAGHRATHGEPFAYFERLKTGDLVFVRTETGWFEYQLFDQKKIQESETWVLADSPDGLEIAGGSALITLTTCDPRWNSYQRWAWWGVLTNTYPSDQSPLELLEGN
jgi:sortase A